MDTGRDVATRAVYAALGAPVVATRLARRYGDKLAGDARTRFATLVEEGERTAQRLQDGSLLDDLQRRVDLDRFQGRLEELRERLEETLLGHERSGAKRSPPERVTVEDGDDEEDPPRSVPDDRLQ